MSSWGNGASGGDRIEVYETIEAARERFGDNYGAFLFRITPAQAQSLLDGKVLAIDISGREYAGFLVVDPEGAPEKKPGTRSP